MKRKAVKKEFFMELRKSFNRFFSIFLIVALGVAFFSGIRAAEPDMELSADRFFDENNLMDMRVLGTYGLTEEDRQRIAEIEGVFRAEGAYTYDVLSYQKDSQSVLKLQSYSEEMNQIALSEGRYPAKKNECVIDSALVENGVYALGEKIVVEAGNEDELSDFINNTEFTIVGIGTMPYYLSLERETSQIGNGSVTGFVVIPEENFCMEVYSEINILVKGAKELVSYRPDYIELVDEVAKSVEDITDERCELRYQSIMGEAEEEIADAQKKLDAEEKKADKKLLDGWEKIEKAKKDIKKGKLKIEEGEAELADGKNKLEDAKKKVLEAEQEYNKGRLDLEKAREEYTKGKKELDAKKKELDTKKKELDEKKKELYAKKEELNTKKKELDLKKKELDASKAALAEKGIAIPKSQMEEAEKQLNEAEKQLKEGEKQLQAAKKQLMEGEKQLKAGEKQLMAAEKQLQTGENELETGEKKLEDAQIEIQKAKTEIADAANTIKKNEKKLADASKEIKDGEKKLKKNEKKYQDGKEEAETKISDAKLKLLDAKEKVADIKEPEWYVLGRDKMQVLAEYGQNAERIGAIGKIFPVIFFLVAALVCLTTMTRMVEEQRTQIGTLKALGYSKGTIVSKYLLYAGIASVSGGVFGTIVGQKVLPLAIEGAYQIMYVNLPYTLAPFNYYYGITSIAVVSLCTLCAAYLACSKEMNESAAQLMRPEAPKNGKRVLLERLGFIWKHLSFTRKASIRNLFRYKKRFFMTIIGIAGCMSLLLVGYGMRDSIYDIAILQYDTLFTYGGSVALKEGETEEEKNKLVEAMRERTEIKDIKTIYQSSVTITMGEEEETASLIIPEQEANFSDYINLKNRLNGDTYELSLAGDGILLTEKVAALMGISVGDVVNLKIDDVTEEKVVVRGIVENYALHYVYMLKDTYETIFNKKVEPNILYFLFNKDINIMEEELGKEILLFPAASEISFCSETRNGIEDMLDSLDIVIWILIISAGLLAFVVLYNLNNININERKRELATLKVLGFYDKEVASYVYRENIMLSILGTIVGIFLGIILHKFVVMTAEINILMFGRSIRFASYFYSAGLTMLFSMLINWLMFFKLKKIDMVESLKSIE